MKITLESTSKIVHINGVPGRVWEGATISGTPVMAVVALLQPQTTDPRHLDEFKRDLKTTQAPRTEGGQAIDARLVM